MARISRLDMGAAEKESVILVVDDEPAVVQSLAALLELETSHRVLTETSSAKAVELARRQAVDMVISDFLMPELDGIAFLLEVRGLYPESTLVLLTGYADKENAIRAINQVGIFQYLEKPWDNDDILTVVRQGLDKRLQLHRLHERARELEARLRHLEEVNRNLERRLQALGN
jgi:DNA-binding NtrC family response regulator